MYYRYMDDIHIYGHNKENLQDALIKIDKKNSFAINGDHELFLFNVDKFKTFSESNILTFQDLVKNKIIL